MTHVQRTVVYSNQELEQLKLLDGVLEEESIESSVSLPHLQYSDNGSIINDERDGEQVLNEMEKEIEKNHNFNFHSKQLENGGLLHIVRKDLSNDEKKIGNVKNIECGDENEITDV